MEEEAPDAMEMAEEKNEEREEKAQAAGCLKLVIGRFPEISCELILSSPGF